MGSSIELVDNYKVKNVIFNNGVFNELEQSLIKILDKKKIKYYKGLNKLNINNNKIFFLNTGTYNNENDASNIIYFKLNNYKFLLMGDAGTKPELDILEKYDLKDIDFFKVGHHGSDTSSTKYFINKIKPNNCFISVGKNNIYNHPKQKVLNILSECNIYRTDLNGSIEIKLKNNDYEIKTISL